ncbi:GntR family transcriptional regulator [Methylobacterium platani]|uniref:GntR family transcriptional regulator n=1 Tax=Methylobacterium platani TaxID=427683 RepID=A0A179SLH0_9HYPH|nr:GntR family transcriptional regulator [Methylobacterium platani]OAS27343.1 GntR family transcriptional regulator [Methylobacterium platani]
MALIAPQPRYLQLAQTLISEIESGRYPVGALMPTEFALCEQFGASRFTVREAIKRLVELGLVSRQAGVGTRVLSAQSRTAYRQVMQGLDDLQQYTAETVLEILDVEMAPLAEDIAALAQAPVGQSWLHMRGLRHREGEAEAPLCVTEIYIHPAFRAVREVGGRSTVPVYVRLEEQFGESVAEVQQQIRAVVLTPDQAERLGAAPGAPALWICRLYLNRRAEVIEVATSVHPAERFSYSAVFRRERPAARSRQEETDEA